MSRVHRRGVVACAGKAAKTYAQFFARITALAIDGERVWSASFTGASALTFYTVAAAQTGTMTGSPWGPAASAGYARNASITCRVMQHALPDEAAFLAQIANGWAMLYKTAGSSSQVTSAVTRNGYTSAGGTAASSSLVTELIRWDGTQAWISNPSTGSAETLYTW